MPGGTGMPIGSRSRWKFSFGHRSSASSSSAAAAASSDSSSDSSSVAPPPSPPASFICPISSSLMYDPVIVVPTGQTFERACIQAYCTAHPHSSSPFFFFIPNSALRAAIIDWCDRLRLPHPSPIPLQSARLLAHHFISTNPPNSISSTTNVSIPQSQQLQPKQREEVGGKDHQTLNNTSSTTITTEKQSNSSSTFSSSSSSSSSSSEIAANLNDDANIPKIIPTTASLSSGNSMMRTDHLEEEILMKLKSTQISVRESGVIALRRSTRDSPDRRSSLCTPRILAALLPIIPPTTRTSPALRINATAAIVNLSIDPPANKVSIVRSGAVPPLVEALSSACSSAAEDEEEARYNAAGALFSLSLEDGNKLAIGVLGAIPPLVRLFSQPSARPAARLEAGMALYHLSLAPNNLSKIAKTPGAVKAILNIAQGRGKGNEEDQHCDNEGDEKTSILSRLQGVAMMVLASLARRNEGRVALMDADAVKAMVRMMELHERERWSTGGGGGSSTSNTASSGKEEEYCLGVLYEMSRGSLRFRALARAAGAERVLISAVTASHQEGSRSGEVGKEMARRIVKVIRGDEEERRMSAAMMLLRNNKTAAEDGYDDEEEEEIGSVVSDGLVSFRRRYKDDFGGGSSSNSANF